MRIWFDLSNSPHINLFYGLITELQQAHDIVITCRPLANTIELLELKGLPFEVVGKHYGARSMRKAFGYPVRIVQLVRYLAGRKVDVAVSQSSFHSPVVARMLGIPSIYMNDNEHALGNVPSFLCATRVLVPEFLTIEKVGRQGAAARKVIRYPGVKEGIYLWNSPAALSTARRESAGPLPAIYIRPEPWTAQYYAGKINFLDSLLLGLRNRAAVTVLPRGSDQARHYQSAAFEHVRVLERPMTIEEIVDDCDLFLGAGGTMTREMAVIGTPTISVYQSELLDVDRFLIGEDLMVHKPDADADFVMDFLAAAERRGPNRELLARGRQAYELIKSTIVGLGDGAVKK